MVSEREQGRQGEYTYGFMEHNKDTWRVRLPFVSHCTKDVAAGLQPLPRPPSIDALSLEMEKRGAEHIEGDAFGGERPFADCFHAPERERPERTTAASASSSTLRGSALLTSHGSSGTGCGWAGAGARGWGGGGTATAGAGCTM